MFNLKKRKSGIIDYKSDILIYDYETVCGAAPEIDLPEEYMLAADKIPTCRDQQTTGQCVCFTAAGLLEIFHSIKTGQRKLYSTTYMYGRHRSPGERTMEGFNDEKFLKKMTLLGSIPNEKMPKLYEVPEAYDIVQNLENLDELDREAIETKIGGFVSFKTGDFKKRLNQVKEALIKYQLPLFGVFSMMGGKHAVPIIGWDKKHFYIMNSWGESYGKKGIGRVAYSNFERAHLVLDADDFPPFPFIDLPEEHWAYHAAYRCYNAGIINGIDSEHFAPEAELTLAQIAQALYKLAQQLAHFHNKTFEETKYNRCRLDEKLWYYKAMNYCYWKGIISNVADADKPLSRADFCDIIIAFIETHCKSKKILNCTELPMSFKDVNEDDEPISKCFSLQLINGIDENTFDPEGHLLRGQMCQIIYKLIRLIEKYEA